MREILIQSEGVGKKFCRDMKKSLWYGLKASAADVLGFDRGANKLEEGEFWANENISFTVNRGECLGLLGHNGSGKTTLLKMLNGIIRPDQGSIKLRGRVGSLIALGAGFDPLLTGRENIYVNGAILGLSQKQIKSKYDEIVDFSELNDFLDSPVRNYSSGMQVRLGFAVAAILAQPDILLLDEVLAVGDMAFMLKCLNHIREIVRNAAVILVSHSLPHIANFCTHAMVLESGRVAVAATDPYLAIDYYVAGYHDKNRQPQQISGSGTVSLGSVSLSPESIDRIGTAASQEIHLEANIHVTAECRSCTAMIGVRSLANEPILHMPLVDDDGSPLELTEGIQNIHVHLPVADLNAGCYVVHITFTQSDTSQIALRVDNAGTFRIVSDQVYWGRVVRPICPLREINAC